MKRLLLIFSLVALVQPKPKPAPAAKPGPQFYYPPQYMYNRANESRNDKAKTFHLKNILTLIMIGDIH